jgi:hypothetical protein
LAVAVAVVGSFAASTVASAKGEDGPPAVSDPFNDRLAIQVASSGQFNFGAFPDPTTGGARTDGTSFSLSFVWPSSPGTSFTTLRVADTATPVDTNLNTPTTAPLDAPDHLSNVAGYTVATDLGVAQTLSVVNNPLSGHDDLGRIEYTVTNNGAVPHNVGLRYMNDVDVGGNDAAPFRVPNLGEVTTETNFLGADIPDFFNVFNDLTDSTKVGAAIFKGSGATTPDRVAITRWSTIASSLWDYTVTPGLATGDSAYAAWWDPTSLAPGASRTFVTYFGLGDVTVVSGPDLSVGVVSPAALDLVACAYDPNPFSVVGTVANNGTETATGVTATIALPAGLALASGTATQSLADLAPSASAEVTWDVQAASHTSATSLAFSVTASATGAQSVTANRTIDIPAGCGTNQPPVANDQSVSTNQDTPVPVTLTASDQDGNALTYSVVTGPQHGTLSGTAPNLTYTPAAGYSGPDSLTFKANDGTVDSNIATVSITVVPTVPTHTLTVEVTGSGSVVSDPPGISCPGTCSAPFTEGASVALTPSPAEGFAFSAWGGACTGAGACLVTMSADQSVTATFTEIVVGTLTVTETSSPPTVTAGNSVLQTFTVTNGTSGDQTNVQLVITLPAGSTVVSSAPGQGTCTAGPATLTCSLGTIPASGTVTIPVVVTVPAGFAPGVFAPDATSSSDQSPSAPAGPLSGSDVVAPTPGQAFGFVPPGGTITTGNATRANPTAATFTLPNIGTGSPISLTTEVTTPTFCGDQPCRGRLLTLSPFTGGYTDPRRPPVLDISLDKSVVRRFGPAFRVWVQKEDLTVDPVLVPDCLSRNHHGWIWWHHKRFHHKRGTLIASPSPCVSRRYFDRNGDSHVVILILQGDPKFGRR